MSVLGHYATIARQLGAGEIARVVARRANRAMRRALHRRSRQWTAPRLAAELGASERDAAERLLGSPAGSAWCDASQRAALLAVLERFPGTCERALVRAERAAQRRFRLFEHELSCGPAGLIDWSADPVSGYRYSQRPAHELVLRPGGADPRYPWALGRMDQLVALGQGYWVSEEPLARARYARQFVEQAIDFLLMNPPGIGIQWTCAMEVALRGANLAQALRMFRDAPSVRTPAVALELLAALQAHGEFVEAHLEDDGAVPNNHLVADYVGLLVIGLLFPELPGSSRWTARAVSGLRAQMAGQVLPDGYSFEGSVPYHRLAVELFALAHIVARDLGVDLGGAYVERLWRMFLVVDSYCSELGLAPQIGDNDSGRVLALADRESLDHGYLAPLGAALFGDALLRREGAELPDEALWLLGERGVGRFQRLRPRARMEGFSSSAGGLHVLRGGGALLAVSAGPNGQRGVGGHSHNDKLSFELHVDGRPLIVDPGTYTYGRDFALRHAFRGTAAHNTVEVDGQEQAPIDFGRLFALADSTGCVLRELSVGRAVDRLVARHFGYARLPRPVVVEREYLLDKARRSLLVEERLTGTGSCELASRLHLPDREARLRPPSAAELARAAAVKGAPARLFGLAAELGPAAAPRAVVLFEERARLELAESAYSRGYGELAPASCVVARLSAELPVRMGWVILY